MMLLSGNVPWILLVSLSMNICRAETWETDTENLATYTLDADSKVAAIWWHTRIPVALLADEHQLEETLAARKQVTSNASMTGNVPTLLRFLSSILDSGQAALHQQSGTPSSSVHTANSTPSKNVTPEPVRNRSKA